MKIFAAYKSFQKVIFILSFDSCIYFSLVQALAAVACDAICPSWSSIHSHSEALHLSLLFCELNHLFYTKRISLIFNFRK